MTAEEWLTCLKPDVMLRNLQRRFPRRACNRKLRLYLCGCCRLGCDLIPWPYVRDFLGILEQFIEGKAGGEETNATMFWLKVAARPRSNEPSFLIVLASCREARLWDSALQATSLLVRSRVEAALKPNPQTRPGSEWKKHQSEQRAILSDLIREVFGNPFFPVSIDPIWLRWNDNTIPRLAQGIYDERAFDRLPILADALEEAGCTDTNILNHCRQPGEHVRGCWVIDLLLGES